MAADLFTKLPSLIGCDMAFHEKAGRSQVGSFPI